MLDPPPKTTSNNKDKSNYLKLFDNDPRGLKDVGD
jgi:hypothetical protein